MEKINTQSFSDASVLRGSEMSEGSRVHGKYTAKCYGENGELKWEDTIDNIVTDIGANQLLDSAFAAGPIAGPYLGLISSVGYTSIPVVGNTLSSHATWNEAGNGVNYPNWSTPAANARGTMTFSSASGRTKSLSSPISFVIATNPGTIKGCFTVFGTGAVVTNNSTVGVLYSAGLFSGGDKVVGIADTLQVSYSISA